MAHLMVAVDNITSGSSYQHVDPHGPRNTRVSIREDEELVAPYFTCPDLESLEVKQNIFVHIFVFTMFISPG